MLLPKPKWQNPEPGRASGKKHTRICQSTSSLQVEVTSIASIATSEFQPFCHHCISGRTGNVWLSWKLGYVTEAYDFLCTIRFRSTGRHHPPKLGENATHPSRTIFFQVCVFLLLLRHASLHTVVELLRGLAALEASIVSNEGSFSDEGWGMVNIDSEMAMEEAGEKTA